MRCEHCGKKAKEPCNDCKDAPILEGDPGPVHYCSSECQEADRPSHKSTCIRLQDRTKFYRVMEIAQMLFYIYRELTWCQLDIKGFEHVGNKLCFYGDIIHNPTWPKDLRRFPSRIVKGKQDRETLLSFLSCQDASLFGLEFVGGLLSGIVAETVRMEVQTKGRKTDVSLSPSTGQNIYVGVRNTGEVHFVSKVNIRAQIRSTDKANHDILKITLRSGENFAVDLSSAQYGYHEPIVPWEEYEETRISKIVSFEMNPSSKRTLDTDLWSWTGLWFDIYRKFQMGPRQIHLSILDKANTEILGWQWNVGLALKDLWKLPEAEFLAKRRQLVNYIEVGLQDRNGRKGYFTDNGQRLLRKKGPCLGLKRIQPPETTFERCLTPIYFTFLIILAFYSFRACLVVICIKALHFFWVLKKQRS